MQYETEVTVAQVEACLALFKAAESIIRRWDADQYTMQRLVTVPPRRMQALKDAVERVRGGWDW